MNVGSESVLKTGIRLFPWVSLGTVRTVVPASAGESLATYSVFAFVNVLGQLAFG